MKRYILLIFLLIVPYVLISQVIINNEGLVVNNTVTGTWEGINIPRAVKTSLTFINNSITSVNAVGYLLQCGDEGPLATNNNLDGAIITGNKLTWNGTDASSITHGMFLGYNINYTVKYNYLENTPYGILFKSGNDAGTNMTYSSGYGASYNIVKNAKLQLRMKGINGVQVYNNTFYSNQKSGSVILIDANHDRTIPAPSTGAKIKNNIFYTVNQIPNISIESACLTNFESDYNVYYCESGSPLFSVDGASRTFSQWQAMGYDQHSVVINPKFNNTTGFVPAIRLDYGKDLGTTWQTGLSTSAAWSAGTAPSTTAQNGKWQVGAVIYPQEAVTTTPVTTTPVTVVNTPPVVVINFPSENLSGFVGELDATGSYDANKDNLTYTWVIPSNISVSSANSPKISFLSPVVSSTQTIEFTLKVSDGKTTQSKTIPLKIIPYKPELEYGEVINIEASSFQPPYYPYTILDGNIATMWSANGDDQWLIMELKELFSIQHVKISFQPGQKAESYFDVFGSEDKETWDPILTKSASCGFSGDLQVFDFPVSKSLVEYRYIKLVGHSNSVDSWNHISEFKVFGYGHLNPGSYEKQPVKLYPNPAHESVNIRIDDLSLGLDFIRIVNLTGKVVYEEKMDPEIKDLQIPVTFRQGIYIVQMGTGKFTMFSQKLVVSI
jgi:hypothetical protein